MPETPHLPHRKFVFDHRVHPKLPTYLVFDDGRIWDMKHSRHVGVYDGAYRKCQLRLGYEGERRTINVHGLVCEAFWGPPPFKGAVVRHLDGNRRNSEAANVAWGSQSANAHDKRRHGTLPPGPKGPIKRKLSSGDGYVISVVYRDVRRKYVAAEFGISESYVNSIRNNYKRMLRTFFGPPRQ